MARRGKRVKRGRGAARPQPPARTRQPRAGPRRAARPNALAGVTPGMQPINPYLTVRDVAAAVDFYERAFGFRRRVAMPGPGGALVHAELTHRESVVMLRPVSPQAPAPDAAGAGVTLYVYVPDVDRVTAQAQRAGAAVVETPTDQFWGDRTATLADPDGHRWMLATFKKLVPLEAMKPPR